ncbi:MAG: formate dehydrogenase accessory protein FdhE [Terriglobales bacterium]
MKRSKWDQRIQRADELTITHPFAAEVLRFYKGIATLQKELYAYVGNARGDGSGRKLAGLFDESLDLHLLLPKFPEFLFRLGSFSPAPVAESAANLRTQPAARCEDLLTFHWGNAVESLASHEAEALLAWIFLQPYAELLADRGEREPGSDSIALCPFCGGKPLVGALRPEGDGGKRFLICALCSTEWAFRRILCPSCGEESVDKLAVYTASEFNHVRVEGCDSCQHYIKTVDLTKNGLAVPVVDELATIPLNLWAQEHGYTKLRSNLLGI